MSSLSLCAHQSYKSSFAPVQVQVRADMSKIPKKMPKHKVAIYKIQLNSNTPMKRKENVIAKINKLFKYFYIY